MSRTRFRVCVGVLLVAGSFVAAAPAAAQAAMQVRVVSKSARIQRSCCAPVGPLLEVERGTVLDVLRTERDWVWVIVPADGYGTRRGGWIRAGNVEPVTPSAADLAAKQRERDEAEAVASAAETASIAEDNVTITDRRDGTSSTAANASASASFQFEDVHFDRNRYALRPEDLNILRPAVTALKADPSLIVNIEGHTCNLGTPAYNMALGVRRADAVKDYLVSQGIAAERLHTVSLGEAHPEYDNSHEQTRKLNRRVAVVPKTQP
jgi:outer membrane protein OmpA-like peptidoglycan-associated protein